MVKIQKRVNYGLEVLQYYTTKEWFFTNDYFVSLREKISKQDNETFYTDMNVSMSSKSSAKKATHAHLSWQIFQKHASGFNVSRIQVQWKI